MDYFEARQVNAETYVNYKLPSYLKNLPKEAKILDFGCGLGQSLRALKDLGFKNLYGADINAPAMESLAQAGIKAKLIVGYKEVYDEDFSKFDVIILSHVLEHFPKEDTIPFLQFINQKLLAPNGSLFVLVPNAQSSTGCYWAYEDFTHHTLFTAGSLLYVLKCAGFKTIEFFDIDCFDGVNILKKPLRKILLLLFRFKTKMWNFATASSFHTASPVIYSYEIKAKVTKS